MKNYVEYTIKLNVKHADMFCQNTEEEIEEMLSKIINDELDEIYDTKDKE